jgi:hypothetical protein
LGGVIRKDLACCGEGDTAAETLEEIGAELLLKLADLGADGGLGAETRLGGLGKTLQSNDFQESVELIEVHSTRRQLIYESAG